MWILAFFGSMAFSAQEAPQSFTFDGRAYSNAAGTTPLLDVISTKVQILNPAQDCILYEETQSVSTTATNGYFTIQVGSATGAAKRSAGDSANSMTAVFSNVQAAITGKLVANGAGCVYNPASGDKRYVRVQMTPAGDGVTRTFSPNMALDSVPSALVAERAESLQGLAPANLLQVNGATASLTQANAESIFSTTNFPRLTTLLSVAPTAYVQTGANGSAAVPSVAGNPGAGLAAGQIWYDSSANLLKYYDGAVKTVGTSGGTTTLADGKIFVGNAGGVATEQTPSGDVSMSNTGVFAVNKIKATPVSATPTQAGHVLKYDGTTNYTPGFIGVADVRSTVAGNAQFFPTNCTAAQTITWSAPSDVMVCTDILVSGSSFSTQTAKTFFAGPTSGGAAAPAFRAITAADLPATIGATSVLTASNAYGITHTDGTVIVGSYINAGMGYLGTQSNHPLGFFVNDGPAKMTLATNGRFGIGTSAPNTLLEVRGGAAGSEVIRLTDSNDPTNQYGEIQFSSAGPNSMTLKTGYVAGTNSIILNPGNVEAMRATGAGTVGIGITAPTAVLHLKAGTATANTAPLKLTLGTNLTTPEAGAVEYDGTNLFYTDNTATRRTLAVDVTGGYLPKSGGTMTGDVTMAASGPVIKSTAGQTLSIYGGTTAAEGGLKLGSGGPTLYGKSGAVGIGITTPLYPLQMVSSGAGTQDSIGLSNYQAAAANVGSGVVFEGQGDQRLAGIYGAWADAGSNGYMSFKVYGGSYSEKMRLSSAGYLGVGTTNPEAPLTAFTTSGSGLLLDGGPTQQESPAIVFKGDSSVAGLSGSGIGRISYDSNNEWFTVSGGNIRLSTGRGIYWPGFGANNISLPTSGNGILHFDTTLKLETKSDNTGTTSVPYGKFGIGTNSPGTLFDVNQVTAGAVAMQADNAGTAFWKVLNPAGGATNTWNAADAVQYIGKDAVTSRSINAAGTINASGADFAEWVDWTAEKKPEMGSVILYKGSYVVVSSPSTAAFVGNDIKDPAHAVIVAFAGQLPVLVRGQVREGDLIIANGDGTGRAVRRADVTVAMAAKAVGTAWASSDDPGLKRVNVAIGIGGSCGGGREIANIKAENQELKAANQEMKAAICEINPRAKICQKK
jgi:hypothetical protein